jgi:lipopolysaccharide/colanic/teichoic acid biosynthesis glycosyltransferase
VVGDRLKRGVDVIGAASALLLLSPLMLIVAVLVRLRMGSPVLFRQTRPGLHGQSFELIKFRTMTDARTADGAIAPDDQRLTALGRWLRRTSIDELPELVNVLRGEMSLVGPRPLLVEYLPLYSPEQARRHEVRPGITGWTQVNGRNALSWDDKFAHDLWYVDHRSLRLDAAILARTVRLVVRGDGVSAPGHATMENFRGSAGPTNGNDPAD